MATASIRHNDGIMIVTVHGELTPEEIIRIIREHYFSGTVRDVIWDLTDGTMSPMTGADLDTIARTAMEAVTAGARPEGKTYFVGSSLIDHNIFCKYVVSAELLGTPARYQVFKTLEEALSVLTFNSNRP